MDYTRLARNQLRTRLFRDVSWWDGFRTKDPFGPAECALPPHELRVTSSSNMHQCSKLWRFTFPNIEY